MTSRGPASAWRSSNTSLKPTKERLPPTANWVKVRPLPSSSRSPSHCHASVTHLLPGCYRIQLLFRLEYSQSKDVLRRIHVIQDLGRAVPGGSNFHSRSWSKHRRS